MSKVFDQESFDDWGELDWIDSPPEPMAELEGDDSGQPTNQAEIKRSVLRSRLALGGLVLAGAFGLADLIAHHPGIKDTTPIAGTANQNPDKPCPAIPDKKLTQVVKIVHQPENPLIAKTANKNRQYLKSGEIDLGSTPGFGKAAHEAATANNLHLAEADPYYFKMLKASSFSEQLKLVNEYSQQFGFKIDVDFKNADGNVQPIDHRKVNVTTFNRAFLKLIGGFEYLPIEVVKATGLKHLRVVKDFVDPNHQVANIAAEAYGADHIDISLSDLNNGSPKDPLHEMGHLFDYNFCGDYGFNHYDPQYTDLNPGDFEYGTDVDGYWQDATISQYGASNQMEDKAEMFARIFGGVDMAAIHSRHPAIRQKYELLLARLNERVPGSVEYLKQISR